MAQGFLTLPLCLPGEITWYFDQPMSIRRRLLDIYTSAKEGNRGGESN